MTFKIIALIVIAILLVLDYAMLVVAGERTGEQSECMRSGNMKEVIVKLTSDHIKVKGAEYVQDLVRCKECKHMDIYVDIDDGEYFCRIHTDDVRADDFCSYGEVRDE